MDNNFSNDYQQQNTQNAQYQAQTPQYQPYQQGGYQPQVEEPVSIGDWVGSLLLFNFVPCVGLILCIVWAFSKNTKKSKANFCKAYLIIMLISIALSVLIGVVFGGIIGAALSGTMY